MRSKYEPKSLGPNDDGITDDFSVIRVIGKNSWEAVNDLKSYNQAAAISWALNNPNKLVKLLRSVSKEEMEKM